MTIRDLVPCPLDLCIEWDSVLALGGVLSVHLILCMKTGQVLHSLNGNVLLCSFSFFLKELLSLSPYGVGTVCTENLRL